MGRQDAQTQTEQFFYYPYWTYEIFAVLDCYETYIGSYLLKFQDKIKMGPIGCPETSVTNYQPTLCNILEERMSHLYLEVSLK